MTNANLQDTQLDPADWHLRITVLPQCNLRCIYCNPNSLFEKSTCLQDDEILDIVRASVECGITRVHWTGGEPCIRDMPTLIDQARKLGMRQQVMTTNGTLRSDQILQMQQNGLSRVNISLDSLIPSKNTDITGRSYFNTTMKWIKTACDVFELPTKMNIVAMSDNLSEIPSMITFAQQFDGRLMLKFIELCPNNPAFYGDDMLSHTTSRKMLIEKLSEVGELSSSYGIGDNPNAEYFEVGNTGVKVILITMPSHDYKCGLEKCRKLRISPYGLAGSCIQQKGISLLGVPYENKVEIIRNLKDLRESYSDVPPVNRKHLRLDYGIWRFGEIKNFTTTENCSRT